ncbi:hypothetical protein [Trinickia mobilis]|uniref:hypothetical protein n=1 Tax=Trinickia mobilis TaxID=2816356 RepID=UPI001A8CC52B|nr:hypothetical protein [Trinickia mobilis]
MTPPFGAWRLSYSLIGGFSIGRQKTAATEENHLAMVALLVCRAVQADAKVVPAVAKKSKKLTKL